MRKDVKLGFAIGGVLLAVLIVYVLVVPGSDKPVPPQSKGPETETVVGDTPQLLAKAPAPSDTHVGDTHVGPATAPVNPPNGLNPDVFAKGNGDTTPAKPEPRWDKLLDGEVPLSAAVGGVNPIGKGGAVSPDEIATTHTPTIGATPPTTQELRLDHPTAPAGSHTHVIREGETLSSISAATYGSANLYTEILKANPSLNPSKLKIGQTINLPELSQANHEGIANAAVSGEKVTINSTTEYKVAPGDSLYKISVKLYGKSDFSTKIYDLNKAAIGADPAKLKVGSVLKLPQAPTVASTH